MLSGCYKITRTALVSSVAAVAKGIFEAAPLWLQAVPEWQLQLKQVQRETVVCSRDVIRLRESHLQPALQPLPNGFLGLFLWGCSLFRNGGKSTLKALMRTALAASVATVAKWISGAVPLWLQAAPEQRIV